MNKLSEKLELAVIEKEENAEVAVVKAAGVPDRNSVIRAKSYNEVENKDLLDDYNLVRSRLHGSAEKQLEAINVLQDLAIDNSHPRLYEVLSQMYKSELDTNMAILRTHEKMSSIANKSREAAIATNQSVNVERAVFVGNLDEILKISSGRDDE